MKPGVRIINCARGGIVDEDALADALESGHVAGAALDVFVKEPPGDCRLTRIPNVIATPHLGASTDEAQQLVALEAAEIITSYLLRGEIRHAVNMVPVSAAEMRDLKPFLDVSYRLGLLLSQLNRGHGLTTARIHFRGEAAAKNTQLMTSAFAVGLLEAALDESVNIVNAALLARERGIELTESSSSGTGDFSTLISAEAVTDETSSSAAGTIFGNQFLRLVRLQDYPMEAYLDGMMLIYRHRDVPGLIGFIGTICGKHGINIASMALGRKKNEPGGDSIAVLNVDNEPSPEVLAEIAGPEEVTGVELVKLPPAGAPLPWFVSTQDR